MRRKSVSLAVSVLLVLAWLSFPIPTSADPAELHVGPFQPYSSIQEAVDAAVEYDTIIVHAVPVEPDYEENVDVSVNHLTIREGDGEDVTVKAANANDHVFDVSADYVTIQGFTVIGATDYKKAGIHLGSGTDHCTIENNRCGYDGAHKNYHGIYLYSSKNNTISGNTCNYNDACGIHLHYQSNNNTVSDNTCNYTNAYGIWLWNYSSYNTVSGNECNGNSHTGIRMEWYSGSNTISNNICSEHNLWGFYMYDSSNNTLRGNTCNSNDTDGIMMHSSSNNTILENTCNQNNRCGIWVCASSNNNTFYLNNFSDSTSENVYSSSSTNTWNSPHPISYIYGGNNYTNYLGNYYGDYGGSDPDGDGIGNTPYPIDVDEDSYPLMLPFIPGDANWDGVVDVFDLVKVKRIILGVDASTPGADANLDGEINVLDLVKIKRIILGID